MHVKLPLTLSGRGTGRPTRLPRGYRPWISVRSQYGRGGSWCTVAKGATTDWSLLSRATLTIWVYDSVTGAAAGEIRLQNLAHREAVTVADAITTVWVKGTHRPRMWPVRGQRIRLPGRVSILGRFVDILTGTEAGGPSELATMLAGTGIDQAFLEDAAREFVPNTSALLVLSTGVDLDVVRPVIEHGRARGDVVLLHAYLAADGIDAMVAALGAGTGSTTASVRARRQPRTGRST